MPNVTISVSDALLAEVQAAAATDGVTPQNWIKGLARREVLTRRVAAEEVAQANNLQTIANNASTAAIAAVETLRKQLEATL